MSVGYFEPMRAAIAALSCLTLAACSTAVESQVAPYVLPSMPTMEAQGKGIKQAAADAKLSEPLEISDVRQTDHGPGRYFLCIRGVESKYKRLVTYAVFFDNDDYKGLRLPVILDECEKQDYRPFP
jgi:hypothetical protein